MGADLWRVLAGRIEALFELVRLLTAAADQGANGTYREGLVLLARIWVLMRDAIQFVGSGLG